MKTFLRFLTSLLLLFNGIGAVYGGVNLIMHPDGRSLQLSVDLLKHTPFKDFLIAGIVLLLVNGLFSFFVFIRLLLNKRNYSWFVIAQGLLLTGWIIIQVMLIQTIYYLHFILISVGFALTLLGILLLKQQNKMNEQH
jgi:hypothetical protein